MNLTRTPAGRRVLFASYYFVEGAPIGFLWWSLPAILRSEGVEPERIGALLGWLVLPWAFKWLWAPLIDAWQRPGWTLRGWIAAAQVGMVATLVPLLFEADLLRSDALVVCLCAHAVFASTQDAAAGWCTCEVHGGDRCRVPCARRRRRVESFLRAAVRSPLAASASSAPPASGATTRARLDLARAAQTAKLARDTPRFARLLFPKSRGPDDLRRTRAAMQALLPVTALLLSAAILLTGNGLQGILLPVRAELEGFSTVAIALIGSSYFAGFAIGCLFGPRLVRSVGHIRTYTAMTATAAAIALLHSFIVWPACWWALRMVTGFCFAVLYMVIESWLNERATRETRGFVLSAYMIINLTVITVGQMLLPLHDPKGMELFAIASILVSFAAVPVALTRSAAPAPIESAKVRIGKLYSISPTGLTTCFAVGFANGPFWALGPQFARSSGLDDTGIALFMSTAVLGGALGQWPLGRLSDLGDRRRVILLASFAAALAGLLVMMRPFESTAALLAMGALWGAFAFSLYSLGVAHANDHAAPSDFVETSSGLLLVYAAGAITGPFIASLVTDSLGHASLFGYSAVVHVVLIGFVLWRTSASEAPPHEEQIEFAEALQAARTVSSVFDEDAQAAHEPEPVAATATPD